MARKKVTLRAELGRGSFYWVCEVNADSEEEAVAAAENLFQAEVESASEWQFDEFNVE